MRGAGWCLLLVSVLIAGVVGVSPRLPRTSAGQLAAAAAAQNKTSSQLRGNKTFHTTIGPPPGRGASSRVRYKLYNIIANDESGFEFLRELRSNDNFDFWSPINKIGKPITVMATPTSHVYLESMEKSKNIKVQLINNNLGTYLRKKRDQFMTYDEVNAYIQKVAADNPNITWIESVGQSFENRSMNVIHINQSGNESYHKLFVEAAIHGRDWATVSLAIYLVDEIISNPYWFNYVHWIILPIANPDGYTYSLNEDPLWKKTLSKGQLCDGVDPNKNFAYMWMDTGGDDYECSDNYAGPEEFSEIETRNIRDYLNKTEDIRGYVSLQNCGQYVLFPYGHRNISADHDGILDLTARMMSNRMYMFHSRYYDNGVAGDVLEPAAGTSTDWTIWTQKDRFVFSLLLPCDDGMGKEGKANDDYFTEIAYGLSSLTDMVGIDYMLE